jgi:hypothetical protein
LEESTGFIILIFILRFVRVILLLEVVLWREGVLLSSDLLQIWQVCVVVSVDISINVIGSVSASVSSYLSLVSK